MAERSSKKVGLIVVLSVLIGIVATLCALFAYLGITLNSLKDDTLVKLNDGSMVSVEECEPDDCTPGAEIVFTVEDKEYTIRYVRGTVVGMEKAEDGTEQIKVEAEGQLTLISFESIIGIFKKSLPGLLVTLSNTIIDDSKLNVIGMEEDPEENTGSDIPELERDEAWELMQLLNFQTPYQYLKWAGKLDYSDTYCEVPGWEENPSAVGIYTEQDLVNVLSKHYTEEYIQKNFIARQHWRERHMFASQSCWVEANGRLYFFERVDPDICSFVESTFQIQKNDDGVYSLICEMEHPSGENWLIKAKAFYENNHYKVDFIEDSSTDIPELDFATAAELVDRMQAASFPESYFNMDGLIDYNAGINRSSIVADCAYGERYYPVTGVNTVEEMIEMMKRHFTTESIYEYIINIENPCWCEIDGRLYVSSAPGRSGYYTFIDYMEFLKISEGKYAAAFWYTVGPVSYAGAIDMYIVYDNNDGKYKLNIFGKNKNGNFADGYLDSYDNLIP